jgi:hypothetical protein
MLSDSRIDNSLGILPDSRRTESALNVVFGCDATLTFDNAAAKSRTFRCLPA